MDFTTITFTGSTGVTIVSNNSFRIGKYCLIDLIVSGFSSASGIVASTTVAPSSKVAVSVGAGTARYGEAYLSTSGNIQVDLSGSTGGEIKLVGAYIAS